MSNRLVIILLLVGVLVVVTAQAFYVVREGQQVVLTQFGKPVGEPILEPGLHLKIPFIQKVNYFDKRILEWDGDAREIPTLDKKYIWVDTTARWRIKDPLAFLKSVVNERGAQSRLDDIIDAVVRDVVTSHNLIEIVRTTNRVLEETRDIQKNENFVEEGALEKVVFGREKLASLILEQAKKYVPAYGIELVDVRIKRVNYVEQVRRKVYERMITERKRAAEKYRSEGRGVKAEIEGKTTRELKTILSQAYKKAQEIKGEADAKAVKIYADAYSKDPELYSFLKTLDTYKNTVDTNTTVILTTDSDYYKYLKEITPSFK